MRILISSLVVIVAASMLVLVGCASASKQSESTSANKRTLLEYRELAFTNVTASDLYQNPEFTRLKQEGWTFMGVAQGQSMGNIVEGTHVYYEHHPGPYAVFTREYNGEKVPPNNALEPTPTAH